MKNKKLIIGAVIGVALIGIALAMRKKKLPISDGTTVSDVGDTGGTTSSITPTPETSTPQKPEGAYNARLIIKDGGKGTSNVQVEGNMNVRKGDSVEVYTDKLKGTYPVWYVYHGTASGSPVTNVHLDGAPYKAETPNVPTTGWVAKK